MAAIFPGEPFLVELKFAGEFSSEPFLLAMTSIGVKALIGEPNLVLMALFLMMILFLLDMLKQQNGAMQNEIICKSKHYLAG